MELRLEVALPAFGRRIASGAARVLFLDRLPALAAAVCCYGSLDGGAVVAHVECVEEQETLRGQLAGMGLVGFVADGAVLARASGDSDLPLDGALPFVCAEPTLRCELPGLRRPRAGLGIRAGVTLIVGGGYHGCAQKLVDFFFSCV